MVSLVEAALIVADLLVAAVDSTANKKMRHVVGNKADAAVITVGVVASIIAYVKGALNQLVSIKVKTDNLPAANEDVSGSINWDYDANSTTEIDISALFSTPLTGSTRRRYTVDLNLTAVAADAAAWTICTFRSYRKVNGGSYVKAYKAVFTKAMLADVPCVILESPASAEDTKLTMQLDVQLSGDVAIPYSHVKESLE